MSKKIRERRSNLPPNELGGLPARVANALHAEGLRTAEAVREAVARDDVLRIPNLGPGAFLQIHDWLVKKGLLHVEQEFKSQQKTETVQRVYWTCSVESHRHPTQTAAIHCMQRQRRKAADLKREQIKAEQAALSEREQLRIFREVISGRSPEELGVDEAAARVAVVMARRLIEPFWDMKNEGDFLVMLSIGGMRQQKERVLACLERYEKSKAQ